MSSWATEQETHKQAVGAPLLLSAEILIEDYLSPSLWWPFHRNPGLGGKLKQTE